MSDIATNGTTDSIGYLGEPPVERERYETVEISFDAGEEVEIVGDYSFDISDNSQFEIDADEIVEELEEGEDGNKQECEKARPNFLEEDALMVNMHD